MEIIDFGFKDLKTVLPSPLKLGLLMENFDFGFKDFKNVPLPWNWNFSWRAVDSVETMLYAGRITSRLFSLSLETSLMKSIY